MTNEIIIYHAIKKLVSGEMDKGSWGYALDEDEIVSWEEVLNWINQNMRDATSEEMKSTHDYIESISKPTGVNFFEQQTAEDCVSRAEVIDIVNRQCVNLQDGTEIWRSYVNDTVEEIVDRVRELTSVTPKQTKYNEIITQIEQARDKDKNCGEYPYNRCIEIIKGVNDGLY